MLHEQWLWEIIFTTSFVSVKDDANCKKVCKLWNKIISQLQRSPQDIFQKALVNKVDFEVARQVFVIPPMKGQVLLSALRAKNAELIDKIRDQRNCIDNSEWYTRWGILLEFPSENEWEKECARQRAFSKRQRFHYCFSCRTSGCSVFGPYFAYSSYKYVYCEITNTFTPPC